MKNKTVVIKVGTNSISNEDGTIDKNIMKDIVSQISLSLENHNVLLITSGAVGAGRSLIKELRYDEVTNKQIFAAVGQVELMHLYANLFKEYEQVVAQILATKADFANREHYLNMKNCLESLMREKIVPIMNENDVVAIQELMFTDNDELAGLICKLLGADMLLLVTSVDGVYDASGEVVECFNHDEEMPSYINEGEKSSFGRGGMHSKFKTAQLAATNGADVFVVSSKNKNFITRLLGGEKLGTHFKAKTISHRKK